MSFSFDLSVSNDFKVDVQTTSERGFTPEEVASRCTNKLVSVADSASPEIKQQANAFKDKVEAVVSFYIKEAIKSDRTTIYNILKKQGHEDMAEIIRRL